MVRETNFKKTSYGAPVQILLNPDLQFGVGVVVDNATSVKDDAGRKIVKAGTPLVGDLTARNTAFTVATSENAASVVGVLLHDVEVTSGKANGTLLIFGFVNINRLDSATKAMITDDVKKAIPAVRFIAG